MKYLLLIICIFFLIGCFSNVRQSISINTNPLSKNIKERDFYEPKEAQSLFSKKLKELGVFVNGNGLYHFSMAHTQDIIKGLITIIKRASTEIE